MPAVAEAVTANEFRQGVTGLAVIAASKLQPIWAHRSTAELTKAALLEVLPSLLTTYASAAATLAANWYDDLRAQAEVTGRFTAIIDPPRDYGVNALAGWGVGPLFQVEPDWHRSQTLVAGGVQLRIANSARDTIAHSAVQDPAAHGWQRVGDGSSCSFCLMLIARGAVYADRTARFAAHDHCGCQAAPAFKGKPVPVQKYTPTSRNITDADRARVRDFLRTQ